MILALDVLPPELIANIVGHVAGPYDPVNYSYRIRTLLLLALLAPAFAEPAQQAIHEHLDFFSTDSIRRWLDGGSAEKGYMIKELKLNIHRRGGTEDADLEELMSRARGIQKLTVNDLTAGNMDNFLKNPMLATLKHLSWRARGTQDDGGVAPFQLESLELTTTCPGVVVRAITSKPPCSLKVLSIRPTPFSGVPQILAILEAAGDSLTTLNFRHIFSDTLITLLSGLCHLASLESLDLNNFELPPLALQRCIDSLPGPTLLTLSITSNRLEHAGLEKLFASPNLRNLKNVALGEAVLPLVPALMPQLRARGIVVTMRGPLES